MLDAYIIKKILDERLRHLKSNDLPHLRLPIKKEYEVIDQEKEEKSERGVLIIEM